MHDAAARVLGQGAQQDADEIGVPQEVDVRGVAPDVGRERRERVGRIAVCEAAQERVEQFRLSLR